MQCCERQRCLDLQALGAQDQRRGRVGDSTGDKCLEERGLADPWLPADHHAAGRAVPGTGEEAGQVLALALTTD